MSIPWKRVLRVAVLLLALGFLSALLVSQWQSLQAQEWRLEPLWALVSLAGLGLAWLAQVGLWRSILHRLGGFLRFGQAVRVWFLSNIIRYIPGNVWQFLGMAELAAEQGISRVATLTSIVLHQVISIASGLVLAALYFASSGEGVWLTRLRPFLYALPLGLLLLQPRLLERMLNWLLARLKRQPLRVTLTWPQVWALLLGYGLAWVIMGTSFAALVRALTPLTWGQVPSMVAIFAAAYVIGFLSLLTPSGLGVREGVLTLLLSTVLTTGVAAVVAIVARLWMVIGELLGVAGSLLLGGRHKVWEVVRGLSRHAHAASLSRKHAPSTQSEASSAEYPTPSIRSGVSSLQSRTPDNGHATSSTHLTSRNIAHRLPHLLLLLLILAYTAGFSMMSIRLHDAHLTHKADLGQMDLAIWNTSRGRFVQEVRDDFVSTRLTDHVEPIFAPVSLLFWLWDDVRALLVLQSFALAIGALPVFWVARSMLRRAEAPARAPQNLANWLGLLFAGVYLLFPALQAANLTEFHAIPLAVPFILFAFWAIRADHWGRFALACVLLMTVKEEAALLAFMLGLYAMAQSRIHRTKSPREGQTPPPPGRASGRALRPRPLITGAFISLLSLTWFAVATFIIIPRHAVSVYSDAASVYFQRYGELGDSIGDIMRSLITKPVLVWGIVTEPLRLRYLVALLAPMGFLPLLAPDIVLLGAPLLIANLLSSYAAQYSGQFHYSAPLVSYFVVAAVVGADRLLRWLRRRGPGSGLRSILPRASRLALLIWVLGWSLAWQVVQGYTPIGREFRWPEITAHHRLLSRFMAQIPPSAPGSATASLYPHLSHREKLYEFPHLADAEWALLDVSGTTDMHPVALRDRVQQMLGGQFGPPFGQWGVIDSADGYLLLQKGSGDLRPDESFYDFARAPNPAPQFPADLTFGGALRFIGYDVVDDARWRLTRVRTYWQALEALPGDLRVYPFFVTVDGTVVEDTTERPPIAPLWYPPSRWAAAETIVVETLPWYLPREWGLAIGVTQGQSWEQRQFRWPLSDAASVPVFEERTWALSGIFERTTEALQPVTKTPAESPAVQVDASFDNRLLLRGHSSLPYDAPADGSLDVTLWWEAKTTPELDYTIFLHLREDSGRSVAQVDAQPTWYGPQPTSTWTPGQVMRSALRLHIPDALSPGPYQLVLGLYDWRTLDRLPVIGNSAERPGNELVLGIVRVLPAGEKVPPRDLCCALVPECCVSMPAHAW